MTEHLVFLKAGINLNHAIEAEYAYELVALSILIAILSSYVSLLISMRLPASGFNKTNIAWLLAGVTTLSSSVWSMHFVGMLAYELPITVNYDIQTTVISIIPALLASFVVVLTTQCSNLTNKTLLVRATLMGACIGAMHYIGMSGIRMEGYMLYDPVIFTLSIIIAIALSFISLKLKIWAEISSSVVNNLSPKLLLAAAVMGSAISCMHYTGMAGMYISPDSTASIQTMIWEPRDLALIITIISMVTALLLIVAVDMSKRLELYQKIKETKERQDIILNTVADAIISIDKNGDITSFNPSAETIFGYQFDEIISRSIDLIIPLKNFKPENPEEANPLIGLLNETKQSHELEGCHKNGRLFILDAKFSPVNQSGHHGFVGIMRDITLRKKAENQLSYHASHDALTGLINRREFENRAKEVLDKLTNEQHEHALCFMDLDQFKIVNDTCGHTAGDELLRQVSKILTSTIRKRDILSRLGGDEFGVLMEDCSIEQANRVTSSILKNIQQYQFSWEGQTFHIGVSIGLVSITQATINYNELLKQADEACYLAKDSGRNRVHVYNPVNSDLVQRQGEMQWVSQIHKALEENRFCLYAQPIVPLGDSKGKHYEILIRMILENGKVISPAVFIPAAERYNLIEIIDSWVIKQVFSLLKENPDFVDQINFVSINLSGPSLTNSGFLEFISTQLRESKVPASKICFEITETVAISNLAAASAFISILKQVGCHFALDDFGSGLSSFGYLKNLSVDYLKIDGMFVKNMVNDPIDSAMVKSINDIGHVMGMKTIAEFVENEDIKNALEKLGVNFAQGYGVGKPQLFNNFLNSKQDIQYSELNASFSN